MDSCNFIEDEQLEALKRTFLVKGKGRRPDLPPLVLDNKLLLQLHHLRLSSGESWSKLESWFFQIFKHEDSSKIRHLIEKTVRTYNSLPEEKRFEFLTVVINLDLISPALTAVGITRKNVHNPPQDREARPITNEFVIELHSFFKAGKLKLDNFYKWIISFFPNEHMGTENDIASTVSNTIKEFKKLQKQKHRSPDNYKNFLHREFKPLKMMKSQPTSNTQSKKPQELQKSKPLETPQYSDMSMIRALYIDEREKAQILFDEVNTLKELNNKISEENNCLQKAMDCIKGKIKDDNTKKERAEKVAARSYDKLINLKAKIRANEARYKRSLKKQKVEVNGLNIKLENQKTNISQLTKENSILKFKFENELSKQSNNVDNNQDIIIDIKDVTNNTYSNDIRKTVIALQSEAGVAACNVSTAIRIVSECLFHHSIDDKLPCTQTAINMFHEGGVISNVQAAEEVIDCENVTLHLDGTSKDHSKIVGHQVTLDNGSSLSLGFTHVVSEDASTLVDITLDLFKNVSSCFSLFNKVSTQDIFHKILSKVTSTMSDRAAVMKSFGEKFKQFLQTEIGDEVQVNFLYCNAHFLLGLSNGCIKGLEKIEYKMKETSGESLGRDKEPLFKKFRAENECATNRLIRTLCDILGPRGDQKSGCRVLWQGFCESSFIPCFKANRFNCFFEAAAAIIHHQTTIKNFFTSGVLPDDVNLKIKSVAADVQDDNLLYCLSGIALLYLNVTEPYWRLLRSGVKYVDFYLHVQSLHSFLLRWSSFPSELLNSPVCVFGEKFMVSSPMCDSVYEFLKKLDEEKLISLLKVLCFECLQVIERQLCDFLVSSEGIFSQKLDEETAQTLSHCPVTNLLGESVFGDLDQDINRCPNKSFFSRSSANMVKRNKTVKYILSQKKLKRARLFAFARHHSRTLLKKAREHENDIKLKVKQKLVENQQKKITKKIAEITKNSELLQRLGNHSGPCKTASDVDSLHENLISENKREREIMDIFKDEIRFQKLMMGGKHLTLKGTTVALKHRLKEFLDMQNTCNNDDDVDIDCLSPPQKRQRIL